MTNTEPPTPPRHLRLRPAALLHGSAVLVTTAVLVVTEAKVPPYKGD